MISMAGMRPHNFMKTYDMGFFFWWIYDMVSTMEEMFHYWCKWDIIKIY